MDEPTTQAPVIEPGHTFGTVTDKISSIVLTRPTSNGWLLGFGLAFLISMGLLYAVGMMAGGWGRDAGDPAGDAPGFPADGWRVRTTGLTPAP